MAGPQSDDLSNASKRITQANLITHTARADSHFTRYSSDRRALADTQLVQTLRVVLCRQLCVVSNQWTVSDLSRKMEYKGRSVCVCCDRLRQASLTLQAEGINIYSTIVYPLCLGWVLFLPVQGHPDALSLPQC